MTLTAPFRFERRFKALAVLASTVFIASISSAYGQDAFEALVDPAVAASVSADIYVRQVEDKVFGYDRQLHPSCADRRMATWTDFRPVDDPLTRDYQRRGAARVYRQQVKVEGCDASPRLHNLVVVTARDATHPPVLTAGVPGTTRTWPHLQYNVQQFLLGYALKQSSGLCLEAYRKGETRPVIVEARFEKEIEPIENAPGAMIADGVWTEVWTARLCERTFREAFLFEAEPSGGASYALLAGRSPDRALKDMRETAQNAPVGGQ